MGTYALRRLIGMVPTLLFLILGVVLLARIMPGDVIDVLLGEQAADESARAALEEHLGLNRPLPVTYVQYVKGLFTGNLGMSIWQSRPVSDLILQRVNVTLELALFGLVIGWSVGCVIGVISAIWQDTPVDYLLRGVAILGLTIPNFALATAVVLLPAIYFNWSPPLFYTSFSQDPVAHLKQLLLPGAVLGASLMGSIMRITRAQVLEILRQDYVRTARAKGLRERTVVARHVLRNAMIPVVSVFGLQVAALMSGTVILENIFALPGLGRLMLEAVNHRDYPVIQGITVVVGLSVMLVNLLVDLSYVVIDPRLRTAKGA